MKIKVSIVESDRDYLERLAHSLSARYPDDIQVYSFTDLERAVSESGKNKVNLLVSSDRFDVDMARLPRNCGFAYLVEQREVETIHGQPAICKYQKVDLIYKRMLGIYSDIAPDITGVRYENDSFRQIVFTSPCGGVGTSTMAAAFAIRSARKGHRVLYLNLEMFGSADTFFRADGLYDMSDIIYVIKSRRSNAALKIESCIKQDASGVFFLSQPKSALDILGFTSEDRKELLDILRTLGKYDMIVMDSDFSLEESYLDLLQQMDAIVLVSDGSILSNIKMFRAYDAIRFVETGTNMQVSNRMMVAYNRFDQQSGSALEALDIKELGIVPQYRGGAPGQIMIQLASMNVFDALGV